VKAGRKIVTSGTSSEFDAAEIGRRLRLVREALGYTQPFIAQVCDMSPQAWNNNECGRDRISVEPAIRLCAATGIGLDWIYRGLVSGLPAHLAVKIFNMPPETMQAKARVRRARAKSRKQVRVKERLQFLSQ
jgi:transcriptional regulator with XRE-family HTH domain